MSIMSQSNAVLNGLNEGYFTGLNTTFSKLYGYDLNNIPEEDYKDFIISLYLFLRRNNNHDDVVYWMDWLVVTKENKERFIELIQNYKNL